MSRAGLRALVLSAIVGLIVWVAIGLVFVGAVRGACEPEPITVNTPTGIAGCEVWGDGIASHYGPGNGVAMNFCTWELRHASGCGSVTITSADTGRTVVVPVIDFCDCYTGTSRQRVVDLQYGVVAALGLDRSRGLYPVTVWPAGRNVSDPTPPPIPASAPAMPNTSTRTP